MSVFPKTKVFDGQRYRFYNDYLKKDNAEWEASKLRSRGWRTRITKLLGLYGVYRRR